MNNDTKSRIMLWLFIFLLCMFSFLAGRVTGADTYIAPKTPTALNVKIDALQGITNLTCRLQHYVGCRFLLLGPCPQIFIAQSGTGRYSKIFDVAVRLHPRESPK